MNSHNLTNPGSAVRLIGALAAVDAQAMQNQLCQQLEIANRGMSNWAQSFTGYVTTTQTALGGFQRSAESTFNSFAQGMTKSTDQTSRYASSVAESMSKSLRSILSSISGESIVRALYNSGLGFYYLAIQAYDQAAQAFEAAAIFGSVAGVAGGLGGAVSGSGSPSSGSSPSRSSSRTGSGLSSSGPVGSSAGAGGNVTVMVMGEPQAASWLTRVISTGVEKYDMRLTASHTRRSAPVGR